jgi:hypothetical protein
MFHHGALAATVDAAIMSVAPALKRIPDCCQPEVPRGPGGAPAGAG